MKKIGWCLLIGLLTITTLKAQEKTNDSVFPKNVIKIHPLDAISGGIGLNYERVLKPKTSIEIELFQHYGNEEFDDGLSELNYDLFLETDIRRYLSKRKKAPSGFFIAAGVLATYSNFNRLKNEDTNEVVNDVESLWVGAAVKIGHQWVFKKYLKGFTTEINSSIDYRTRLGIFDRSPANGVSVLLRLTIGYSW